MPRIFITGSTEGIGRAAARSLLSGGHQVVLHARSKQRASALEAVGKCGISKPLNSTGSGISQVAKTA
jgi:NAD(P)-dependent dehydrogenase (short-subunit alcohol dehydrogenase family)